MTSLGEPISPAPSEYHSRAPEFYGFVAWTSASLLFVVYVLWALLPDEYIVWAGVEWYPNREWSLLIPAWSIVVVLLTYFTYMALTIYGTPAFDDISAVTDSRAQYPLENDPSRSVYDQKAFFSTYAPYTQNEGNTNLELYDVPIELVNRVLYARDSPILHVDSSMETVLS
ncbi:PIG-P [Lentinula raphanica]|uniref:PIG-P n=1 Tax=Lentinula raphanica TaxID=153919 RepID=A0AA38UJ06_9AGAR|nr:PIG-P [Lentinula raphanica]KAJ3973777.1 PIG-P [Lentinula raphanica]